MGAFFASAIVFLRDFHVGGFGEKLDANSLYRRPKPATKKAGFGFAVADLVWTREMMSAR